MTYTTIKSLGEVKVFFFFKDINIFIQQGCIKLMAVKSFVMLKQIFISNKCCSFELFIKEFWKQKFKKIWNSTTVNKIIIRNVSWAANQHIRMISEGSCDTEDWSNDAENSALPSQG